MRGVTLAVLLVATTIQAEPRVAAGKAGPSGVTATQNFAVRFPDTAVGATSFAPCFFLCFQTQPNTCNSPGVVHRVHLPSDPFRAGNFRVGRAGGGCGGVPASFPVNLAAGEWLLSDFEFSPRAAGNFMSSATYDFTTQNSSSGTFGFDLIGTGISRANVIVSSRPSGMLQEQGVGGATDEYSLTNIGLEATSINLTQMGDFFTQSPSSFSLPPGGTQVVTLTGLARGAGDFSGSSIPMGSGVPSGLQIAVRLVSAARPAGPVIPVPSTTRSDLAGPRDSNPSGSVSIVNQGTSALRGLAESDVPWLIPPAGPIIIDPGATGTLPISIDRSKRPDSDFALGSVTGTLTVTYLTSAAGKTETTATSPGTASSSVVVVDTSIPNVSKVAVPPVAAAETAFFIPGVSTRLRVGTDVFLSNVGPSLNVGAVQMFYVPAATPAANASLSTIGQIAPNAPVAFGDIGRNLFGAITETGTLQFRLVTADRFSLGARLNDLASSRGSFGTSLPVIRGDRGVAAGVALVLPGVVKDANTRTDVLIQETSGAAASVTVDFLAATGAVIGSRPAEAVPAFGLRELADAVPAGAVTARVTNTAGSAGRVFALAIGRDSQSGDSWTIVPSEPGAVVVPLVTARTSATETVRTALAMANSGGTPATGVLELSFPFTKRRAVRRSSTGGSDSQSGELVVQRSVTLQPFETQTIANVLPDLFSISSGSGAVKFTPTSGNVVVSGRISRTAAGQLGTSGTSVGASSVASALKNGETKSFTGLEDASEQTIALKTPVTYRSGLGLTEVSGKAVNVRVTVRYTFPGSVVQAFGTATKDFALMANEFLLIDQIGMQVIGAGRNSLPDLRNVQVDVSVTGGEGSIVAFATLEDNGTGDLVLRLD